PRVRVLGPSVSFSLKSLGDHLYLPSFPTRRSSDLNDIVVDDRGNAYVNTIGFDFPGGEFAPGLVVLATPDGGVRQVAGDLAFPKDRKSTRLNSSHQIISYAVFCLKKKKKNTTSRLR